MLGIGEIALLRLPRSFGEGVEIAGEHGERSGGGRALLDRFELLALLLRRRAESRSARIAEGLRTFDETPVNWSSGMTSS